MKYEYVRYHETTKGYTRSNEELAYKTCERLTTSCFMEGFKEVQTSAKVTIQMIAQNQSQSHRATTCASTSGICLRLLLERQED